MGRDRHYTAMTTPTFPDELPGVSEFQFAPTPQLAITDIPMASRATRRISQIPGALATAVWNFSGLEYQVFMTWWREELFEGHRWFRIKLPSAAGLQYTIVRFLVHRDVQNKGYKHWTVTGTLEILERRIRPEVVEQFLTTTLYPILDQAMLVPTFTIPSAQLSPPVPINETFQAHMSVLDGNLRDLVQFGYGDDSMTSSMSVLSGSLRDVLNAGYADDSMTASFTVLDGSLNIILITNEIPSEGLTPSFSVLNGSLT